MKNNGYELVLCAVRPAVDKVRNFGLKPLIPLGTAAETCERPQDKFAALPREALQSCEVCTHDLFAAADRPKLCP